MDLVDRALTRKYYVITLLSVIPYTILIAADLNILAKILLGAACQIMFTTGGFYLGRRHEMGIKRDPGH